MKLVNYPRGPQIYSVLEVIGVSTIDHNTRQDEICQADVPIGAMNPAVGHQEEGL